MVLHGAFLNMSDVTQPLPSKCRSMLVLSRFLARATSPSVTLVQRVILTGSDKMWSHVMILEQPFPQTHHFLCVCTHHSI